MKNRALIVTCVAAVGLTACKDLGLGEMNIALDKAERAAPPALVTAVHGETQNAPSVFIERDTTADTGTFNLERMRPVAIGGRTYIASGREQDVPRDMLRPIGSFQGRTLFALNWDERPFDRLYMPGPRTDTFWELRIAPDVGPDREPQHAEPAGH